MPLPGAQVLISSRLSALGVTRTSTKPASASQVSVSCTVAAPAMQPHSSAGSSFSSAGNGALLTTSEIASRPPGFSTRKASRNTCALSGTRLITQFERITSAVLSATGRCSSSPSRNSTLRALDLGRVLARLFQHLMGHVDADHLAGLADLAGGEKAIEAGAAAEIDHGLARLERGDRLRVAAAEAEIGAFRHGGELGIRIAHLARFARRDRRSGRSRMSPARSSSPLLAASAIPP